MSNVELYKALAESKKKFGKIFKDKTNPFFDSKYADLETIMNTVENTMVEHGLLIVSKVAMDRVKTIILHLESGESIESEFPLTMTLNAQSKGSEITYGRRYSIQCLLNLVAEDDDGNGAIDLNKIVSETKAWVNRTTGKAKLVEAGTRWHEKKPAFEQKKKLDDWNTVNDLINKAIDKGEK